LENNKVAYHSNSKINVFDISTNKIGKLETIKELDMICKVIKHPTKIAGVFNGTVHLWDIIDKTEVVMETKTKCKILVFIDKFLNRLMYIINVKWRFNNLPLRRRNLFGRLEFKNLFIN